VKGLELREKTTEQLTALEGQLRDKLVRLGVAKATQRATNTAQFSAVRRDIARVKTILRERQLGLEEKKG
jgi:large subunit ribosomal protein L29